MTLFDRYVAVDWSANNGPKTGGDSVWVGESRRGGGPPRATNQATRSGAAQCVRALLADAVAAGERVLVGFDFPYGYPAGFAAALGLADWLEVWSYLAERIRDSDANISNRFAVAERINRELGTSAPFWGRPAHLSHPALPCRKEVRYRGDGDMSGLPEWRRVEQVLRASRRAPQPAWKLAYAGSVGSQSLVGIPIVHRLRADPVLAPVSRVWPFEVRLPSPPAGAAAIVHAEIWPSLVPFAGEPGSCNDERQVRTLTRHWRELDEAGRLAALFAAAPDDEAVRGEEGWILGVPATADPGRPRSTTPT